MIYLQNKYTKWYYSIVANAKSRTISMVAGEKHHIIPECFYKIRKRKGPAGWIDGNANAKENIVFLSTKEHLICHLLLTKMVVGKAKSKMHLALFTMARHSSTQNRYRITSRMYEIIRKNAGIANSGENNPMWGKIRTKEERLKISEGIANSNAAVARTFILTDEHKLNISKGKIAAKFNHSEETKLEWSRKRKGRPGQDNNSGKHWFNDGVKSFFAIECPPGCFPGRLTK